MAVYATVWRLRENRSRTPPQFRVKSREVVYEVSRDSSWGGGYAVRAAGVTSSVGSDGAWVPRERAMTSSPR